ncbi:hypothetical protein K461DRAFT_323260 [Myriangium duriaei CBS 260.36]|uniref:Uncharacterized protein n=1 Tax=Myriangium duriaei CBS 260.36 TaxID=1168546 RepID=A0A9P4IWD6_9PEZI|nr:hypothetical protein K461DRAFT_323260 [Myriangium duriaei CBS 260.36]
MPGDTPPEIQPLTEDERKDEVISATLSDQGSNNEPSLSNERRPPTISHEARIGPDFIGQLPFETGIANSSADQIWLANNTAKRKSHSSAHQDILSEIRASRGNYIPFWVSIKYLACFFVLLLALAASSVTLWTLSRIHTGFATPAVSRYLWTYGPTALLTVISSLWKPVEYSSQLLQPWSQLCSHSTDAWQGIFLDYVSPMGLVSILKALRARHIVVFSTIIIGMLLQLATIVSTGLLVPIITPTPWEDVQLELLTAFYFNDTIPVQGPTADYATTDSVTDYSVTYEAYALLIDDLPFPDGLQTNLTFQQFALPNGSLFNDTDSKIRAVVDIFQPDVLCEPANLSNFSFVDYYTPYIDMQVSWSHCRTMSDFSFGITSTQDILTEGINGVQTMQCQGTRDTDWFILPLIDVRHNSPTIPAAIFRTHQSNTSDIWGVQIVNAVAAVCTLNYSIKSAEVVYDLAKSPRGVQVGSPLPDEKARLVNHYSRQNFSENVVKNLFILQDGLKIGSSVANYSSNAMYTMMNSTAEVPLDSLYNDAVSFANRAAEFLQYIGVQVGRADLMTSTSRPLVGQMISPSRKLLVSSITSWLMTAAFLIAIVFFILLVSALPRQTLSWPLGSITGVALLLLRIPSLNNLLQGSETMTMEDLEVLSPQFSKAEEMSTPGLTHRSHKTTSAAPAVSRTGTERSKLSNWWRPLLLHPVVFSAITFFCVAIIVVLEVLQHVSSRDRGIAYIHDPNSTSAHLQTRIIPSTVLAIIGILASALKFNILLLAPFANLKKGNTRYGDGINESFLGNLTLFACFRAAHRKNWAVTLALISSFLGSLLTIVGSGLYELVPDPEILSVDLRQMDHWNLTWPDSLKDDGGAATLLTDFIMLNLSYPSLTHAELAFPALEMSADSLQRINNSRLPQFTVTMPALRADLNCSIMPRKHTGIANRSLTYTGSAVLSPSCSTNETVVDWSVSKTTYDGSAVLADMQDLVIPHLSVDDPYGCPSIAFTFGHWNLSSKYSNFDYITMSCYQLMAQVQTNVTFDIPSLTVLAAVPDEGTVTYLNHEGVSTTDASVAVANAFPYRLTDNLHNVALWGPDPFDAVSEGYDQRFGKDASVGLLDAAFRPLDGETPMSIKNAVELSDESQKTLVHSINRFYRHYMAQVINKKMRIPLEGMEKTFEGTWIDTQRVIVQQDRVSKLILQLLLGVILVSGTAAYVVIGTKKVLRHNPCSIAGTASLLAGSRMCTAGFKDEDEVDEYRSDIASWAEQKRQDWSGMRFRMDEWNERDGLRKRRYGIDIDDEHLTIATTRLTTTTTSTSKSTSTTKATTTAKNTSTNKFTTATKLTTTTKSGSTSRPPTSTKSTTTTKSMITTSYASKQTSSSSKPSGTSSVTFNGAATSAITSSNKPGSTLSSTSSEIATSTTTSASPVATMTTMTSTTTTTTIRSSCTPASMTLSLSTAFAQDTGTVKFTQYATVSGSTVVNAMTPTTSNIDLSVATSDALTSCGFWAFLHEQDYVDFSLNWRNDTDQWDCVMYYNNPNDRTESHPPAEFDRHKALDVATRIVCTAEASFD